MLERDGYPAGVPCWTDVIQPDLDATIAFYGELFGWTFEVRTPDGAPAAYAYARRDGLLVGGVGGPPQAETPAGWTTYVWVDSADAATAAVQSAGGAVLTEPFDVMDAGRMAVLADPDKAAAVRQFIGAFVRAGRWSNDNEDAWAKHYYTDFQRIASDDTAAILAGQSPLVFQTSVEAIPHHQKLIDILYQSGSLKERFDAAGSFVDTFDDVIAGARA